MFSPQSVSRTVCAVKHHIARVSGAKHTTVGALISRQDQQLCEGEHPVADAHKFGCCSRNHNISVPSTPATNDQVTPDVCRPPEHLP